MALVTEFWTNIYPVERVTTFCTTALCTLVSTSILCRNMDTLTRAVNFLFGFVN